MKAPHSSAATAPQGSFASVRDATSIRCTQSNMVSRQSRQRAQAACIEAGELPGQELLPTECGSALISAA